LERFADTTLLEVELETGRKNQIRVHLSEAGCPVVGDQRYGARISGSGRIHLHAHQFILHHPITGKHQTFETGMPPGFLVTG
jgi:23S rRNA pseudouridine1911/1915/1917 synthase